VSAVALLSVGAVQADLVTNGGFEAGNFTAWTETGDTSFNGVQCPGPDFSVQSGNCSAFFGPVGTLGGISQALATVAGAYYDISFWLEPDGGTVSQFIFNWDGGLAELSLSDMLASGFVKYSFLLPATTANTSLSFSFRDDVGFINLDSVTVNAASAVPEPGTLSLALAGLALVGVAAKRRRR